MSEIGHSEHQEDRPQRVGPDEVAMPEEVELSQPELAKQSHQIIEEFAQAMKRNPNYNADDNCVDFLDDEAYHVLQLQIENNPQTDTREEKLEYRMANRKRIGASDWWTTPVSLLSTYNDTEPQGGYIRAHNKSNTPSAIQEVRKLLAEKFGDPQPQTPSQQ